MSNIIISVLYTNASENHCIGEEEAHETRFTTISELYKFCIHEFGACKSKIFVDTKDPNKSKHVGWYFERKEKYEDCNDKYLRGVWVTVHDKLPETVTTEFLSDLSKKSA
jgi:hypothetical protein